MYTGMKEKIFFLGELYHLTKNSIWSSVTKPIYFNRIFEQITNLGIGSLSITIVIGLTMGLVMTLQFGHGLAKFGGTLYVPAIVSLSLFREMAPIFTSLLVAGRVGSGIAAEIGAMNVTQQVDALRALGTSPIRVLVVPRLLALMIALPLLTALADFFGLLGGFIVANLEFDMSFGFYLNKVLTTLRLHDLTSGMIKAIIFAMIIVLVACYKGLRTKEGTKGVGSAATWVVVTSSIWILISDFFMTKLMLTFWMTN